MYTRRPHENTPNTFVCTICAFVVATPVKYPCHHVFCDLCSDQWTEEQGQEHCPTCKHDLRVEDITPLDPLTKRLLKETMVRCRFGPALATPDPDEDCCLWAGEYSNSTAHLAVCEFAPFRCACKELVRRKDKSSHEAKCWALLVECEICGEQVNKTQMDQHNADKVVSHVSLLSAQVNKIKKGKKRAREPDCS